jgi:hypothetical protein
MTAKVKKTIFISGFLFFIAIFLSENGMKGFSWWMSE